MIAWLKKTFVAHEGNDHHPHFWRNSSVAFLFGLIAVTELGVFSQAYLFINKDSFLAAVLPGVVASLTNEERVVNSATPLKENSLLDAAAKLKAEDMASKGYFSHTTPEGYTSWYWLQKVGYQYSHAGENLAVNFKDSKDIVNAWMNSPTHRANIVKQIYTEIGIGMAEGIYQGRTAIFVVQFFGTPAVAVETAPIAMTTILTLPVSKATTTKQAPVQTEIATPTPATTTFAVVEVPETQVAGAEVNNEILAPGLLTKLAASPRHVGMYVLLAILSLVILAYLSYALTKRGMHHPKVIAVLAVLVFIIGGILTMNNVVLRDAVIIGQGSSTLETP